MKKNLLYLLAAAAMLLFASAGCEKNKPALNTGKVTGVTLDITSYILGVGDELTLEATVWPEEAPNRNVTWDSSNKRIVTVENGLVTALKEGKATITVETKDGQKTATCDLTVVDHVDVTGVRLNRPIIFLAPDYSTTLTATVLPENADDQSITWTSDNENVATVEDGVVKALKNGTATITVTTSEGKFTATSDLTVNGLGETAFKTEQTWTVGDQTWSDAVMGMGCRKTTYYGGYYDSGADNGKLISDCRANSGYGDLFSWQAIDSYASQLCPAGWRIPTRQDFIDLDKAMGGTGSYQQNTTLKNKYLSTWGGQLGGVAVSEDGTAVNQTYSGGYWSATAFDAWNAHYLAFGYDGQLDPGGKTGKTYGFVLRCIQK